MGPSMRFMPRVFSQPAAASMSARPTSSSSMVSKNPKKPVSSFHSLRCSRSICAEQRPTTRPPRQAVKRMTSARRKNGFFAGSRRSLISKSSGAIQAGSPRNISRPASTKGETSSPGRCTRISIPVPVVPIPPAPICVNCPIPLTTFSPRDRCVRAASAALQGLMKRRVIRSLSPISWYFARSFSPSRYDGGRVHTPSG